MRVSYIVLIFVKSKNYKFIRKIKHVLHDLIAWWNLGKACENSGAGENLGKFVRIPEQVKTSLICFWIFPNACLGFHQAIKT